jgi:carbonic anhydrase
MKKLLLTLFSCLSCSLSHADLMTPDQALQRLLDGNQHFVNGNSTHPSYVAEAKSKLLEGQNPFAIIIGCSDSRVPPELIFDAGLGDLFVIRDAGNVIGPIEMDSAEFAVDKLNVPIVMVLGHQNCGAIKATLAGKDNVRELESIYPLIQKALKGCTILGESPIVNATKCNVKKGVEILKNSPTISPLLAQKSKSSAHTMKSNQAKSH